MSLPSFRAQLMKRPMQLLLSLLASASVSALLAATIYWTLFDPRWLTFLGGVLFAAVLAMASRASHAQWVIARRTLQLDHMKKKLAEANARSASATDAFKVVEARLRALGEALTQPVFLFDRQQRCRFHNGAAAQAAGLRDDAIDGRALHEIVGEVAYVAMKPHVEASLGGRSLAYELAWENTAGKGVYAVHQMPYPANLIPAEGLCIVLNAPTVAAGVETRAVQAPAAVAGERPAIARGDTLYLREIAKQLTGWDDPKGKLTLALERDQFLLFEQRISPLEIGHEDPLCYEILLRLQEEEDHLLPPGGFLPEAERYGMMEQIDRWVVRNLITHCLESTKRDPGWRNPLYCVNLSAAALRAPNFAHFVQQQIQARKFDGRSLCFEINEADIISLPAEVRRLIAMLKPFGCRFTVDAFGSVKGSFAPLKDLAIDFIKIDGVVIQNILRDPAQLARTRAISMVCRKLDIRAIAEFVENPDTLRKLRGIGVHYAQGFGISRPQRLGTRAPQDVQAVAA